MSNESNPAKPARPGTLAKRALRVLGRAFARDDARRVGRLALDALPNEWTALEAGKLYAIYTAPHPAGFDTRVLAAEDAAGGARLRREDASGAAESSAAASSAAASSAAASSAAASSAAASSADEPGAHASHAGLGGADTSGVAASAAAAPDASAVDALFWHSARAARTRDVTVVLARDRAAVAQRLRELGFGENRPASGWPRNLNVLAMPPGADTTDASDASDASDAADAADATVADATVADAQPRATQPVAFGKIFGGLRALKRFGFRPRSLYFIEGAERWFNWHDAATLAREGRMLADWCAARDITLVLLLARADLNDAANGAANDIDNDARNLTDIDATARAGWFEPSTAAQHAAQLAGSNEFHAAYAGVARMQPRYGELLWHVDFWRTGRALVTGETSSLRFTDAGRLTAERDAANAAGPRADTLLARDEERVVVTRAAVDGYQAWLPPHWEVLDDQAAVLRACAHAQAATVVLDFTGGAQLEALCATVHGLRRQAGRALKIVVVERGEVLRHQYELLVLSLGANFVLGRDLPFSRMQSLLQSLQGQLHTRPFAADYRAALGAALSGDTRGYLAPAAFCEHVRGVLERSALVRLPHVLVKLALRADCPHVDALAHCAPRRAGDVFTADAAHLYVFLFACRLADADAALARIFDVPVDSFAQTLARLSEREIGAELATLDTANRRARIADYSDLFGQPSHDADARTRGAARELASLEAALATARDDIAVQDGTRGGARDRTKDGTQRGTQPQAGERAQRNGAHAADASTPDASTPDASASNASTPDASAANAPAPNASTPNASPSNASAPNASAPNASAPNASLPNASPLNASPPNPPANASDAPVARPRPLERRVERRAQRCEMPIRPKESN